MLRPRNTSPSAQLQRQILKLWLAGFRGSSTAGICDKGTGAARLASSPAKAKGAFKRHGIQTEKKPVLPVKEFIRILEQWRCAGRRTTPEEAFKESPELKRYIFSNRLYAPLSRKLVTSDKPSYAIDAIHFARQCGKHHGLLTYEIISAHLGRSHQWKLILRTVALAIEHTGTCSLALLNRKTRALVHLARFRQLETILDEFESFDIKPDRLTYELLLRGFLYNKDLEAARRCVSDMERAGFPVQASTHSIIGSTYRSLGTSQAVEDQSLENLPLMTSVAQLGTLNSLLRAHLDNDDVEKAIRILSIFDRKSVQDVIAVLYGGTGTPAHLFAAPPAALDPLPLPNASTFAVLIHFCAHREDFEDPLQVLQSMLSQGIKPSVQVYTAMITACFSHNKPDVAVRLVARTCNPDVTPRALFDPILSGSWDEGPPFVIDVPTTKPNVRIFNSLLAGVLPLYKTDGAIQVLRIMKLNGVAPDVRTTALMRRWGCLSAALQATTRAKEK